MSSEQTIKRIADVAEVVAMQAGVGACELAGAIVSYLSAHPEMTGDFMAHGIMALPADLWAEGRLTFHRRLDGKVTTPQQLRISKTVRDIAKSPEMQASLIERTVSDDASSVYEVIFWSDDATVPLYRSIVQALSGDEAREIATAEFKPNGMFVKRVEVKPWSSNVRG